MKPCPFCGSDQVSTRYIRDGREAFCMKCGSTGKPAFNGKTEADDRAVDAWNMRSSIPETPPMQVLQDMYEAMFADKWDGTQAAMIGAAYDIVKQYAYFIRNDVKADDLEMHPYLPHVEDIRDELLKSISPWCDPRFSNEIRQRMDEVLRGVVRK